MLLKYIKIGTLVHTIWVLCVGIGNRSGTPFRCFAAWALATPQKKQKQKDYTEAEPVQKMGPAQLSGLLCTKHTLTLFAQCPIVIMDASTSHRALK